MKRWLCLLLLINVETFAVAPDSVAGKVFREVSATPSLRGSWESTIILGLDGRYTYLKYGHGNALTPGFEYRIFLDTPPLDGTYTYARTGESSAMLKLLGDDGYSESYSLIFSSVSEGTITYSTLLIEPDGFGSFYFTDLSAAQSAPVLNVSARGQVSPGHPLIVGLVIPGTQEREVLIRAIGPSLAPFGVGGVWVDPDFQIYGVSNPAYNPKQPHFGEVHYGDWSVVPMFGLYPPSGISPGLVAAFQKIFAYLGAFPLLAGSKDAAAVVRLAPGIYTIVASTGSGDAGGEALLEVYTLP